MDNLEYSDDHVPWYQECIPMISTCVNHVEIIPVYLLTKDNPLFDAALLGMGHEIVSTSIQSEPIVALRSLHKELDAGAFL